MNTLQQWARCPEHIDIGDGPRAVRLAKCANLFALRGANSKHRFENVAVRMADDEVSILRGTPAPELASDVEILPVYAAAGDSTPAVATGRIFLRLDEDTAIEGSRHAIEVLGFRIDDIPAYAPHCAWLVAGSGHIDEALTKLDRLRALPRAANVEPQMLRPRGWKADS